MTTSGTNTRLLGAATVLIAAMLGLAAVEVVLRTFPSLVSLPLLDQFPPGLRQRIAVDLGLPTTMTRPRISSSERADHGPDFYLYKPSSDFTWRADAVDLERGVREVMTVDERGFCNPPEKSGWVQSDVLILGDSLPWCSGVPPEATVGARLQNATGLRVYSIALPSIGPYEDVELLRRFGLSLHPKAVVLNLSEGNDLRDILRYRNFVTSGDARNRDEAGAIFEYSLALSVLRASVVTLVKTVKKLGDAEFRYAVRAEGKIVEMNVTNRDQDELATAQRVLDGELDPALLEEPLASFVQLSRENGFAPIVSYAPAAYTAYAKAITFHDPKAGALVSHLSNVQRKWLAENADRVGYRLVDMTPGFQAAAASSELLYYPANIHLTPAGHSLFAAELAAEVKAAAGD